MFQLTTDSIHFYLQFYGVGQVVKQERLYMASKIW